MKVLNLIWGFATGGGIDKCFLAYAKMGEVDKEVEVVNVCISFSDANPHLDLLSAIGTRIIRIKNRRDLSWIRKLKALIAQERPDVLFSHGFNGAIVLWMERLSGVKTDIVLTYHGRYNPPTASRRLVAALFNLLPVWIYRHAAKKVICVSEDSRRQLLKRGVPAFKAITVYNGIPAAVPEGRMAMDGKVINIVSCSRIDAIKGLDDLLQALAALKEEGLAFHYYMIGEGPELERLQRLCRELSLDGFVSFPGYQSNIGEWLNGADIYVSSSLQENHSIAILEAMRAGLAIVATEVGGNGESVRNRQEALLVPPANARALGEALKTLLSDAELRRTLAQAARKRFEAVFTEEMMLKNLTGALKNR